MHPNIDERTERRDVGDDARQWHSRLDIGDGVDAFGEMKDFEIGTRLRPGLASSARMSPNVGNPTRFDK